MTTTLFLQSEVHDPFKLYETMLEENPVYWDNTNNLWAVYSYENCKIILSSPSVQIPPINENNKDGLNEYALSISGKLVRLSNGIEHEVARQTAMLLFENMKAVSINDIIGKLIEKGSNTHEFDWVNSVCKKLTILVILKSFDFSEEDCNFILCKIEQLAKIMLPTKTPEQVAAINEISKEIYTIAEKHLFASNFYKPLLSTVSEKYKTRIDKTASVFVSNFIGLFIQSYDGGRGLLSNSLLQILNNRNFLWESFITKECLQKSVIETLRFDPPVHNTRRIAIDDINLNSAEIKKDESIFIVLAAANRDPQKFNNPNIYDIERTNNNQHLTFGTGSHACISNHFSVNLATETLYYFFERYKTITLLEKNIQYEPAINVRLPKNIYISLS